MRLISGLVAVFALFHWAATALGSDRGQAGVLVGAIVVAALLVLRRVLFAESFRAAFGSLGLGQPHSRGLVVSIVISGALLLVFPLYGAWIEQRPFLSDGWLWLVPGLFAQAGVAEETLFRGYLFGHLRRDRSFWHAAWLSMAPFVAVHLWLFTTMNWPIAMAAVALSVVTSFPFARLFDLGGSTVWAPAILHFVVQGAVKVILFGGAQAATFPLLWMVACALLPMAVFAVPTGPARGPAARA